MVWSFPGISYPVELVYTQTTSFLPDKALLLCNPQVGAVPSTGTITMSWGATTVTLPNCVVDIGSIGLTPDGRYLKLIVEDRRVRWQKAAGISGEYNTLRVGNYITARQKNLRQLGTILMTALGEAGADVSALPTDIYPPVIWDCENVVDAAQQLLESNGYSVVLGYGSEAVKIVKLGTGASLPTTDQYIGSDTIDPKLVPRYVRNCFGPSLAQVRLKLEAVGLETDGTWKLIDSLSYKPDVGWEATGPYSLPGVGSPLTTAQVIEAQGYVRRA